MKKNITIAGVIVLIIGIVALIIGQTGIVSLGGFGFEDPSSTGVTFTPGSNSVNEPLVMIPDEQAMPSIYSSLAIQVIIDHDDLGSHEFTLILQIRFPNEEYSGCAQNTLCELSRTTINVESDGAQGGLSTSEYTIFRIPIIMQGYKVSNNNQHQYVLTIESDTATSFTYQLKITAKSLLLVPIGGIIALIGLIITIIGAVLKPKEVGRPQRLSLQPAFEPTLGGGTRRSTSPGRGSKKKGKSKKKGGPPKRASSTNCSSCGQVMPRNAQYCPHCYARQ
ncbi:MAG: hypothetical protein ACXAC7_03435 [Candidatus Hodarchaeales archaeon]|jgi:hypothetical protein